MTTLVSDASVAAVRPGRSTSAYAYRGGWAFAVAAIDLVMFVGAAFAAEALTYHTLAWRGLAFQFAAAPIVFVTLWMALFMRVGLYRVSFAMTVRDEIYIVATALVLGIVPQFVLFTLVPTLTGSRLVLLLAAAMAMISVGGARALLHALRDRSTALRPLRVAIVTPDGAPAGDAGLALPPGSAAYTLAMPLATVSDGDVLVERCAELGCSSLYLSAIPPAAVTTRLIERARAARLRVGIAPAALRGGSYRFDVDRSGLQVVLWPRPLRVRTAYAAFLKRAFDIAVATTVLVLAAPVMLVAALAITIETGRPILYRQQRVGLDGLPFEMLKFRSMYADDARRSDAWATRGDSRITRVGAILRRLSIDELPQLLNVLRGDMSVVGPRPEMPVYAERFEREIPRYADRHLVKPGITGWSQLYLDRLLTPDDVRDVLRHDLFYIEHWGIFMDLSIVAKTAAEFLFHRAP